MSPQDYRKAGAYFSSAMPEPSRNRFMDRSSLAQDSLELAACEPKKQSAQKELSWKLKELQTSGIKPKVSHLKQMSESLADQSRNFAKASAHLTFRNEQELEENLGNEEHMSVKKPERESIRGAVARNPKSLSTTMAQERSCICELDASRISAIGGAGSFLKKADHRQRMSQDDSLTLFDTTENEESMLRTQEASAMVCGRYCRHLPPKDQARIIAELLRAENASPLKQQNGPVDPDLLQPRAEKGLEGEKKYILSALWWNRWRDYVNLGDESGGEERGSFVIGACGEPDLRTSIDTMRAKLSGVCGTGPGGQEYSRPNKINNGSLLDSRQLLKPGLLEHFDYVGVSQDVWRYLVSWYGCDWIVVRFLRKDGHSSTIHRLKLFLDVYPEDAPQAQKAKASGKTTGVTSRGGEQEEERERLMRNLDRDAKLLAKKLRGSISSFMKDEGGEHTNSFLSPAVLPGESSMFLMNELPQLDDPIPTLGEEDFRVVRK